MRAFRNTGSVAIRVLPSPVAISGNLAAMKYHSTNQLRHQCTSVPSDFGTSCHPVVVIDSLVAIYLHKVVGGCQFPIQLGSSNNDAFVFGENGGPFPSL